MAVGEAALMDMFPQWPQSVVAQVLQAHSGNLNQACNFLLAASDSSDFHEEPFIDAGDESQQIIDAETLGHLVTNLKEIVVPALQSQLCTAQFPEISATTDRVSYSLSGISVDNINIPMHGVNADVQIDDRVVKINAKDIDVAISITNWSYERGRFLRDSGSATASFNGISAAITLCVDETDGSLNIDQCDCTIEGPMSLRANESRVAWVYNFLLVLFRTPLKNTLEATLTEAIRENINSQLDDWMQWHTA